MMNESSNNIEYNLANLMFFGIICCISNQTSVVVSLSKHLAILAVFA